MMRSRLFHFLVVSLSVLSSGASAGGFASPYQSATAIGSAFAGASVRSDDASFFHYNPAIVSALGSRQTYIDARAFRPSVTIEPGYATSPLGPSILADGASGNMARNALAAGSVTALPIARGLMLGLATSAPFAADVETDGLWAGRYHLMRSYMVGLTMTGAVSWQASDWLAVSGGVQVQRMQNRFENLAVIPQGAAPPATALAYMKGDAWTAGPVAGALITPAAGTRIGVGWRSGLTHRIEGTAGARLGGVPVEQVRYDLTLPQTISIGLEQRLSPQWRLLAEWQGTDWSRFKGFDVSFASGRPNELRPIDWRDTWMAAIGAGYRLDRSTELTGGFSYDTGASRNGSGSTLSPDANKLLIGIGMIHDWAGFGRISLSYGHLLLENSPVRAESLASGKLTGTLKGGMDMVGVGYTATW